MSRFADSLPIVLLVGVGLWASGSKGQGVQSPSGIPGLAGTGYVAGGGGLAQPGVAEANFKLVSCPAGPCANQPYVTMTGDMFPSTWLPNTSSAQWIGPAPGGLETGIDPVGVYDYRETFDLTGLDLATVKVSGSFAADNKAILELNGVPAGAISSGFEEMTGFTLSSGFQPGVNTIDILVTNVAGGWFNPSGLIVELSGVGSPPPTTTTLVAAPATLIAGQALTLKGTVRGTGGSMPTGTVGFLNGGAVLATAGLDATGVAASTIYPVAGVYSIVAAYAGDRANGESESAPVTVTVYAGPPTFAITTSGPLTLQTQHHGSVTVSVTPQNGFSGEIALECGSAPEYVTCEWGGGGGSSAQVNVSGGTATVRLEIDTSAVLGYESSRAVPGGMDLAFAVPALCLFLAKRRFRWRAGRFAWSALILFAGVSLSGCSTKFPPSVIPGTYSIPILGVGSGVQSSGSLELIVTR